MRRLQFIGLLIFLSVFLWGCGAIGGEETAVLQPTTTPTPAICPITQPPDPAFVPPEPYAAVPPNGEFWYGTNELWTALWPDGTWQQLPKSEDGYVNKLVWFREGYVWTEEERPLLTISAQQLDGNSVVEPFTQATNGFQEDYGSFMLTGIALPNLGCWQITGAYGGHSLSYVVWVQ
ncbi:MAG: hypothetical protein KC445_18355 [Anaerolineales bacterium]|nr:hypothetical protein [Anaerolineales bacterium]